MTRVALIGVGRLGTSLGNALAQAGYEITALADSDIRAARRARRTIGRGRATSDAATAARGADLIFIAVPDPPLGRDNLAGENGLPYERR
jgi:3-hydroxyisobutyrate dehydrogenase-like beta-hydroxyacid dehydrogenase